MLVTIKATKYSHQLYLLLGKVPRGPMGCQISGWVAKQLVKQYLPKSTHIYTYVYIHIYIYIYICTNNIVDSYIQYTSYMYRYMQGNDPKRL